MAKNSKLKTISNMKRNLLLIILTISMNIYSKENTIPYAETNELNLCEEWDKTFPRSNRVTHKKVVFVNRFGITLAAYLYAPVSATDTLLPAIAVSGPFGAVKEQASGLYAQTLAEHGFITLAFDPSFTGESGGTPRHIASPDINTEDFSAAVDYLLTCPEVDSARVSILGICGFGGMALNAAAMDTRIHATVAVTMYDMSRCNANGYFDQEDSEEARYGKRLQLNAQRTKDVRDGHYSVTPLNTPPADDAPQFMKDYYDYYKTPRGYHPRAINSTSGWNVATMLSYMNAKMLNYTPEIRSAVLLVHGENAHSCYFSKDAYARMVGGVSSENKCLHKYAANKELLLIPNAVHTDLYDKTDIIPFDTIASFLKR